MVLHLTRIPHGLTYYGYEFDHLRLTRPRLQGSDASALIDGCTNMTRTTEYLQPASGNSSSCSKRLISVQLYVRRSCHLIIMPPHHAL